MLAVKYSWDISEFGLILDNELPIEAAGWKNGDMFMLHIRENGDRALVRLDPLRGIVEDYQRRLDNENGK
jgi:hypothetical protein